MSLAVAGNKRLRKALSLYLYLKALDDNGCGRMQFVNFIKQAANDLHVHERTIKNWLKLAIEFELLSETYKRSGTYSFLSWIELSRKYQCLSNRFYYIKVQNINFKFEYILERYAIEEKLNQCRKACQNKYNYNLVKEELENVVSELGITKSLTDLKNCRNFDFLTAGMHLTENQRFFLNIANPDINVGYKRFSQIFNYNSRGGFAYMKRILSKYGLISIESRQYPVKEEFRHLMSKMASRKTQLGQVNYFRPIRTLVLTLCDNIITNTQTQWLNPSK